MCGVALQNSSDQSFGSARDAREYGEKYWKSQKQFLFWSVSEPKVNIKPILIVDGHPDHDEVHVRFTKSIDEKLEESKKTKFQRRPTSGKGLLSKVSEETSSDESEGENVSVKSLIASSDIGLKVESDEKQAENCTDSIGQNLQFVPTPRTSAVASLLSKIDKGECFLLNDSCFKTLI